MTKESHSPSHRSGSHRTRAETGTRPVGRRAFLAGSSSLMAVGLTGCIGLGGSNNPTSVSYRYRFSRNLSSSIIEGGIKLGFWEDEGLDVEFGTAPGADAAAQAVAAGNDDFCGTGFDSAVGLIEADAPVTVIGQEHAPLGGVFSLADADITSWTDLEGAVVGHFPWGNTSQLAMAALRREGGNPDAIELQNIEPGSEEVLLKEHKVDAVIAYWPQSVVRLEHDGYETNHLAIADVLGHLGPSLVTNNVLIDERPEVVDGFVRGWLRAFRAFVTRIEELIDLHTDFVQEFNEPVERATLPLLYAAHIQSEDIGLEYGKGWTPESRVENTLSILKEVDYVEATSPSGHYYTNQFIDQNRELAVDTAKAYYDELEDYSVGPDDV